jgi:hypothetical protein
LQSFPIHPICHYRDAGYVKWSTPGKIVLNVKKWNI